MPLVLDSRLAGSLIDHDSFQAARRHAYQGSCVAILRATADAGDITVTASAIKLSGDAVKLVAALPVSRYPAMWSCLDGPMYNE